ncbi:MAG: DinB family protein [Candidatus Hydrogenedentes bacterium]|nr:DinB family protein [Candidatus Hydrogenedentota bacterium]
MSNPKISLIADMLANARKETLQMASNVAPEHRLFQLRAGKATPLWLLGHLANTANTVILRWTLGQESRMTREQSLVFAPDFAKGTPPSSDPSLYPAWEEVVSLYDTLMGHAIDGVRELNDEDLELPLKGNVPEQLRGFFTTNVATLTRIISHDAYHRGQMGLLSKIAG